jgi:hypothetical protein
MSLANAICMPTDEQTGTTLANAICMPTDECNLVCEIFHNRYGTTLANAICMPTDENFFHLFLPKRLTLTNKSCILYMAVKQQRRTETGKRNEI